MKAVLKGDDVSVMPTVSFDDSVCVCASAGSVLEQNKIWPLCCEKTGRERLLLHRDNAGPIIFTGQLLKNCYR